MTIPSYQDTYPTILKNAELPKKADEYVALVAHDFNISDEEMALRYPTGEGILRNKVRWAIHYLKRAQLLTKPSRGIYVITERGKEFLQNHPNGFNNKDLNIYDEFRQFKNNTQSNSLEIEPINNSQEQSQLTPLERIESATFELNDDLQKELLERILEQNPSFFERLVVTLLSKMGYGSEGTLAKAIGKSGDGGIDGIIHQDKLGLDVVYIQAKRYELQNQISRPDLQSFVGSLAGFQSNKGVFVTTSYFSKPALDYLKTIQTKIVPIDGKRLVELMIEYEVGTRISYNVKLNKVDEDFFIE